MKCEKTKCFANINGLCYALTKPCEGKCPFYRDDITLREQMDDAERYARTFGNGRGNNGDFI